MEQDGSASIAAAAVEPQCRQAGTAAVHHFPVCTIASPGSKVILQSMCFWLHDLLLFYLWLFAHTCTLHPFLGAHSVHRFSVCDCQRLFVLLSCVARTVQGLAPVRLLGAGRPCGILGARLPQDSVPHFLCRSQRAGTRDCAAGRFCQKRAGARLQCGRSSLGAVPILNVE